MLTFAVPKGRVLAPLVSLLARANIDAKVLLADDRTLVRTAGAGDARFLLLKPDDVPTYVEHGAADLGICGRDVLDEHQPDVLRPLDLAIGKCKMVVAAKIGTVPPAVPRVATKYPRITAAHFAKKGIQAEIVPVRGSVELAPLVGLADLIVDLVETGSTLAQNGLEIRQEIQPISSMLIANRAAFKLERNAIASLIDRLRTAV